MTAGPSVLVVDDESAIRRFLRVGLQANGYQVHEVTSGEAAVTSVATLHPDVIILDVELPDISGLDVLARIREWSRTPIIVLSVRDRDDDKIAALDSGADDYLTKPFSMGELLARLRVALRHAQPGEQESVFTFGSIDVDLSRRLVTRGGEPVKLTPTEYSILRLMIQHAGRVLTHRQILVAVWGPEYASETHYLRVYFAQLRQKLEDNPQNPRLLLTEPGVGYRLNAR